MAHDTGMRKEARRAYVYDRQSLAAIAILMKVPEGTLRNWKRAALLAGDNWDTARAASTIAGDGFDHLVTEVVQDYVSQHQATIEGLKDDQGLTALDKAKVLASLADSFAKMVKSAGRVSPKISELAVAMDVLQKLGEFVMREHPKAASTIVEVLEPFGDHLAEVYR